MKIKLSASKPSFWHLLKTVFAAAVGVQSNKNRELDFSQTSIVPYIIAGIVFTAAFIALLIVVVSLVI